MEDESSRLLQRADIFTPNVHHDENLNSHVMINILHIYHS
jgi:hypothetical protein